MSFLLARLKVILAAFAIGIGAGWFSHVTWTDAQETRQLRAEKLQRNKDIHKQAKAEEHEQKQQRHDADMVEQAKAAVARQDHSACPPVSRAYLMRLNCIGENTAECLALGEVSVAAETSGD